jgi:hypothetical protein
MALAFHPRRVDTVYVASLGVGTIPTTAVVASPGGCVSRVLRLVTAGTRASCIASRFGLELELPRSR